MSFDPPRPGVPFSLEQASASLDMYWGRWVDATNVVALWKQRAETAEARAVELSGAIERGGLDLCPCRVCDALVACIPDGLPFCERCAAQMDDKDMERG